MMQLDLIVLVIFAFMIFLIGAAFTRMGSKSGWAFFEAGGATPWWINGLSLFISYFSSLTAYRGPSIVLISIWIWRKKFT